MMKTLISSSLVAALLCGTALAQPAPAQPAPRTPYKFKLAVTDGSDSRTYELVLLDDSCGSVEEHQGDRADEIKLCAHASPQGARLEAHWKLRSKTLEHAVNYEAVVAKGKTVEVGRTNGARFTLTLI
ncbi:hypothetical protein BH11MYX3_BH11MYX3_07840 [soil metagenome]